MRPAICIIVTCGALASATLEGTLRSFAECESDAVQKKLRKRLDFFAELGVRSEEEVKALPDHQARNEQEQVLSLFQALLRPGVRVQLHDLAAPMLAHRNGCEGTLVACPRGPNFRCAVELSDECDSARVRAHVENLQPAGRCAVRTDVDVCGVATIGAEEFNDGEPTKASLDAAAIGQLMTDTLMSYRRLANAGELPAGSAALGETAISDLPYAALLLVVDRLREAGCDALRFGDAAGAELAVRHAVELEESARVEKKSGGKPHLEEQDVAVRLKLSEMYALQADARAARADAHGARDAALVSQRLNISSSIETSKLDHALKRAQLEKPHASKIAKLTKKQVKWLQRWFDKLEPLDTGPAKDARPAEEANLDDAGAAEAAYRRIVGDGSGERRRAGRGRGTGSRLRKHDAPRPPWRDEL